MPSLPSTLLIANRGEIALRIARTARRLGIRVIGVRAADETAHRLGTLTDAMHVLPDKGPRAYLDIDALIEAARCHGCDALHPGYGFLSEQASLARACQHAGVRFIGPTPDTLDQLGDKGLARSLARHCDVPVLEGLDAVESPQQVIAFLKTLPEGAAAMLKARQGGGGRGIRIIQAADDVEDAWHACQQEALLCSGRAELQLERYLRQARHVEIQIAGDCFGNQQVIGDRDCSLQRRHQKLIEIAPAFTLPMAVREHLAAAALRMARQLNFEGLGTFEFLVDATQHDAYFFLEANPRLQVEHTVTETVTGMDLVELQLHLAGHTALSALGLEHKPAMHGVALQLRLNAEQWTTEGLPAASGGRPTHWMPPGGPGIRVDDALHPQDTVDPRYDSLIAKLVISGHDWPSCLARAQAALEETRLEGIAHTLPMLRALLHTPQVVSTTFTTQWLDAHWLPAWQRKAQPASALREGLCAPVAGVVCALHATEGHRVARHEAAALVSSMKMEFPVSHSDAFILRRWRVRVGDLVKAGECMADIEGCEGLTDDTRVTVEDPDHLRPALQESLERHAKTHDAHRPAAVARRRQTGQRTARENIADLCDADSFIEYGALALAAQRRRHSEAYLVDKSPADGLITGLGTVNAHQFESSVSRVLVMAYDYTVFAGTQGVMNHKKADRVLHLARDWQIPLVLFAEGGGGRPGDTDFNGISALDSPTFRDLACLSGLVPLIGIVSGRCFAGNAALLGCCDVIIGTQGCNVGMAGPAMIEAGGLGRYTPEQIGPAIEQAHNGVIDVLVEDETEAVAIAKAYLGYFQGPLREWRCEDQRYLRTLIPAEPRRIYDMRSLIRHLVDSQSFLELRRDFAPAMITGWVRLEGRPFGLMANDPAHNGGAIDAAAGDKAARFLQLCDAYDIPVISLCDTPGFMVGPQAEQQASVRHVSRLFVTAASVTVPVFTVVVRKGYGLGAQAMAAGSFHASVFTVAWPGGEFGAMAPEGAVRLAYAKELVALGSERKREKVVRRLALRARRLGRAVNVASHLEIDEVIDPADTRRWILRGLASVPPAPERKGKKRPMVDSW